MIKNLIVISPGYPTKEDTTFTFVEQLCNEFARLGIKILVISPQSIVGCIRHHRKPHPRKRVEKIGGSFITILQPYYLSIPNRYYKINNWIERIHVRVALSKVIDNYDAVYCHFWRSAYFALPVVRKRFKPFFVATGEGALDKLAGTLADPAYLNINKYLTGVISVSSNNKQISKNIGLLDNVDCIVAPNAVNSDVYKVLDKRVLRDKYKIPQDVFIVAFVGAFIDRKGPQRLSAAIEKVGKDVYSFFIGGAAGGLNIEPTCDGILFKGRLSHDTIPDYLNMADIFVLPTLGEGCCNAVVEALACGLPVVSSNLPFNRDVLNETNSILVNPNNVDEIADALIKLKNDAELRKKLSEGALVKAKELTIEKRAKRIIRFMESKL